MAHAEKFHLEHTLPSLAWEPSHPCGCSPSPFLLTSYGFWPPGWSDMASPDSAASHTTKSCFHLDIAFSPGFCLHRAGVPPQQLSLLLISYCTSQGSYPAGLLMVFSKDFPRPPKTAWGGSSAAFGQKVPILSGLPQLPQRGI